MRGGNVISKVVDVFDLADGVVVEGDVLRRTKDDGWKGGTVVIGPVTSQGVARWSFVVKRGAKTTIGVALEHVNLETYVNQTSSGWGWYQGNGNLGHGGPATREYSDDFKTGEREMKLTVELDADAGTLRFYRDGVDQGIAFDDLPRGEHYVCGVTLYGKDDCVQVVQSDSASSAVLRCGSAVSIGADRAKSRADRTVLRKVRSGWQNGTALLGPVTTRGVARWRFRINHGVKASIGVALNDVNIVTYLNETSGGWGWYQGNGNIGHGGPAQTRYSDDFKTAGIEVMVELDADAGTVRFFRDGVDQGIAFDDLPRGARFVGAVTLYAADDEVEVLHRSSAPDTPSALVALPLHSKAEHIALDAESERAGSMVLRKQKTGWKHGTALIGPATTRGTTRWCLRIDKGVKASVGIARAGIDIATYINETKDGWGWYQGNGNVGHGGPATTKYSEHFKYETAQVTVELNADAGTVRFYREGDSQEKKKGVAFDDLPVGGAPYLCGITLYEKHDVVRLVSICCDGVVVFACPLSAPSGMRALAAQQRAAALVLPAPPRRPPRAMWLSPALAAPRRAPLPLQDFELNAWVASLGVERASSGALLVVLRRHGFDSPASLATLSYDDLHLMSVPWEHVRALRPGIEQLRRELDECERAREQQRASGSASGSAPAAKQRPTPPQRAPPAPGAAAEACVPRSAAAAAGKAGDAPPAAAAAAGEAKGAGDAQAVLAAGPMAKDSVVCARQGASQLYLQPLRGECFAVAVDLEGTVSALKRQIHAQRGAECTKETLILVHAGLRLDDASVLSACAVQRGATLQLIVRPPVAT
jgi:hypothetical protein